MTVVIDQPHTVEQTVTGHQDPPSDMVLPGQYRGWPAGAVRAAHDTSRPLFSSGDGRTLKGGSTGRGGSNV